MMSNEETVELLIGAWKLLVGRLPGSKIDHAKGVATMFAHVPLPFLNISMPTLSKADLRMAPHPAQNVEASEFPFWCTK